MDLMLQPLRKYADFEGRARRQEYWLFALFQWLVMMACFLLLAVMGAAIDGDSRATGPLAGFVVLLMLGALLAFFIPGLAVTVRRLHDSDKSGLWLLLLLVPFGGFVILIFTLLDGSLGPNRFGPDPKNRAPYNPGPTEVHHYHHTVPPGGAPDAQSTTQSAASIVTPIDPPL